MDALGDEEEAITNRRTQVFQPFDHLLHGSDRSRLVCTIPFLKKFVVYAKAFSTPVLSQEAQAKIIDAFEDLRKRQDNSRTLPVTARQLETMIRLTSAHAKIRLSKDATEVRLITLRHLLVPRLTVFSFQFDAEKALEIMRFALYNENQGADEDVPHEGLIFDPMDLDGNHPNDGDDKDGENGSRRPPKRKADRITQDDSDLQREATDTDKDTQTSQTASRSTSKRRKTDSGARAKLITKTVKDMLAEAAGSPIQDTDVLERLNEQLKRDKGTAMAMEELDAELTRMDEATIIMRDEGSIYQT